MRQVGMIAAAGIYALENNIQRLEEDHFHALEIAKSLEECSWVSSVMKVETNIVVINLKDKHNNNDFVKKLEEKGILSIPFGKGRVRMVTHLDISSSDIAKVKELVKF